MCRLFGVYSNPLSGAEIDRGIFLGMLGATNSIDSTGVYVLGKKDNGKYIYNMEKDTENAVTFFNTKANIEALVTKNAFLFMGHCRWATIGAVTEENAQPIVEGRIALCHNGTIESFVKDKNDPAASDSKEFARRLNDRASIDEVLIEADRGAYAITFCNFKNNTLNFARNGARTLHLMLSKGAGTLYWATERWMLTALKDKEYALDFQDPFLLSIDTLYSIKLGTMRMTTREIEKPEKYKYLVSGKKGEGGSGIFDKQNQWCTDCNKRIVWCDCAQKSKALPMLPAPSVTAQANKELASSASVPVVSSSAPKCKYMYKGWNGDMLLISVAHGVLKEGCAICHTKQDPGKKAHWFSPKYFICDDCFEHNPTVDEYVKDQGRKTYMGQLVRVQ